jgi:hypothetical protein
MKQYDIYISNIARDTMLEIRPLTALGEAVYNDLRSRCLEAGVGIDEVHFVYRQRLVRNLRRAGYSVTSRLPKETNK